MKLIRLFVLIIIFDFYHSVSAQCDLMIQGQTDYFICPGGSIGFTSEVIGGNSIYTYSWSPSVGLSNTSSSNPICNKTGIYTLNVSDSKGCQTSQIFICHSYPASSPYIGPDKNICIGDSVKIETHGLGIVNNITWTPLSGIINPEVIDPIIVPSQSSTYILSVKDENNCNASDTIKITVNGLPQLSNLTSKASISQDQNYQVQGVTISGGKPPYAFLWKSNTGDVLADDPRKYIINPVLSPDTTTQYTLEVFDSNGCPAHGTMTINVK